MLLILVIAVSLIGVGCKKKASSASVASADTGTSGDGRNTNYVAGGGAIQNVRQAARRVVALADMQQLGQFIELAYNENGKMPTTQQIKDSLSQAQNILSLINDGTIILTGTTEHGGLWAYEVEANVRGGIILKGGTPTRAQADEVKQLLGQ
jgi:hypothetical protein